MRVFVTGGSGVLGRSLLPRLRESGHEVQAPASRELDLFDPEAVASFISGAGGAASFHPSSFVAITQVLIYEFGAPAVLRAFS